MDQSTLETLIDVTVIICVEKTLVVQGIAEAAEQVIRVDNLIRNAPRQREGM